MPDPAPPATAAPAPRRTLLRRYIVSFLVVVGFPLAGYTVLGVWFTASEHRRALADIQRANAQSAAFRISQFVHEIEGQMRWSTHLSWAEGLTEQHRLDALRLLRLAPAITDLTLLDGDGRERLFVSRVSMERRDTRQDRSAEAAFRQAVTTGTHHGPVSFRRGTEPYITLALAGNQREAGVVLAEVNLATIREVVSGVRVGREGRAYVVDRSGRLIAHPDASLVLRHTDLSSMLARLDAQGDQAVHRELGTRGEPVLLAQALATPLDWRVLVELPEREADEPLQRALLRSAAITAASLLLALAFAAGFAWRMVRPIRTLTAGAARIGSGQLGHRIRIDSADELGQLGRQFNTMAAELERSYATLERKVDERTQALTEANRAKTRFLAAASHDLRQPLHALNLLVAQLQTEPAPAERERLTGRIGSAVGAINGLFDGLLDISRLDAGVVSPTVGPMPVQAVLDRMEAAFAADARAKGLRLRVRPHAGWVASDPVLLERIVGNLVGNALRYTRRGGIVIGCRQRGARLQLEVWDSGIGIPADRHAAIFDEFCQLAPADSPRGEGLGLGLAIVARLCQLLDHPVQLRSWPGRGSCFSLALTRASPAPQPAAAAPGTGPVDDPLRGRRVVVLDNDPGVLDSTAGLLRAWGCRVVAARTADAARAQLGPDVPDLLISDLHLDHGEDGLDSIARLRAHAGRPVPALVISGDVSLATRERVAACGLPQLDKPLAPMRLRTLMMRALQPAAAVSPPEDGSTPGG